jgi:hypothetical protein
MRTLRIPPGVMRSLSNQIKDTKKFNDAARREIRKMEQQATKDFLREFDEHPITNEIEAGPDASNSSGTLNGYGNLFSFIGFSQGDSPVAELRSYLRRSIRASNLKKEKGAKTKAYFTINKPEMKTIGSVTPMPWEVGRSWVRSIERGISGFGYYMNTMTRRFSRSGAGIQVDRRLRSGGYVPKKYMSQMLRNLDRNLRRLVK